MSGGTKIIYKTNHYKPIVKGALKVSTVGKKKVFRAKRKFYKKRVFKRGGYRSRRRW